jgi:hypothetical protein
VIVDEDLEPLTEDHARGLLATGEVGRVGITVAALPAIFPVNYWLIDGTIVFRTARAARCRPPRGARWSRSRIEPTFLSGGRIVYGRPPSAT